MPYDNYIIKVDETTTPHRGVEIADIQKAVPATIKRTVNGVTERRSSADLGVLAGKSVGDKVPDNAGGAQWTVSSRIEVNPMAKYKPVRFNKLAALTDEEFRSKDVRYGLRPHATTGQGGSISISVFASNDPNPNCAWIYDKPRGGAYNEPYRDTDFNRYFHRASPPFAFTVSGELCNSVGVTFLIDQLAATEYNQDGGASGGWHPDYNIKMEDLFNGFVNPSNNSHPCVCIHRRTSSGDNGFTYAGAVVWSKTVGQLSPSGNVMVMYAKGETVSNTSYPAVPALDNDDDNGNDFKFIVGLTNSFTAGTGVEYQVYPPEGPLLEVYPLAFKEGIDRKVIKLYLLDTIAGLTATNLRSGISLIYNRTETHKDSLGNSKVYIVYILSGTLYGDFVTPSDRWSRPNGTVGIKGNITNAIINPTFDTLDRIVAQNFDWSGSAYIANAGTTYNNTQLKYFSQEQVYFSKNEVPQQYRYVSIKAWASNRNDLEKVYFSNDHVDVYVMSHTEP